LRRRIQLGELETTKMGNQTLVCRESLNRSLAPIQLDDGRTFNRRWLRDDA
jgi:hypothetical protein